MHNTESTFWQERRANEEVESVMRFAVACGAKLTKDGNKFCFLMGENLQEGASGFGDTPHLAAVAFYHDVMRQGK